MALAGLIPMTAMRRIEARMRVIVAGIVREPRSPFLSHRSLGSLPTCPSYPRRFLMRMLVLGAGLQGSACAFDLLNNASVERVLLADSRTGELPSFLAPLVGDRLVQHVLDVRDTQAVRAAMAQCDGVLSAIPYYFNFPLAQLAVEAGVHFADLGGNTEIVRSRRRSTSLRRRKASAWCPTPDLRRAW
jgi:hypothetical protein